MKLKKNFLGASLTPEDLGGEIQCIPISAFKSTYQKRITSLFRHFKIIDVQCMFDFQLMLYPETKLRTITRLNHCSSRDFGTQGRSKGTC